MIIMRPIMSERFELSHDSKAFPGTIPAVLSLERAGNEVHRSYLVCLEFPGEKRQLYAHHNFDDAKNRYKEYAKMLRDGNYQTDFSLQVSVNFA